MAEAQPATLPKLNKTEALKHHSLALKCIASGDLRGAETHLVNALLQHPELITLYRTLGELFQMRGDDASAEQCYLRVLPDSINSEYFSQGDLTQSNVRENVALSFRRSICHQTTESPLTKPKCVTMGQHRFFNHRKRVTAEAVVDSVPNGSLWFDGFNRVVNDGNNREIDRHSRGNLELISTICRSAKPKQIEGRLFFVGNRGSNNYYHWMLDILPSFDLFSKAGYQISHQDKVVLRNVSSSFQKSTLKKMGITEDQIIEITRETPYFSADELIVPEFQNAMGMSLGAWIPEFLKSTFLREEYKASGKRLYLARGDNAVNGRSLKNESELIAFLKDYGIETIYPDRFSVQQQARLLASAEVVVSAHGAGMTNIVFCQPGTKIVEIYGEYMQTCYWALSAACELDYYNHYCAADCAAPNSTYTNDRGIDKLQKQGFSVNCRALKNVFHLAGITQR